MLFRRHLMLLLGRRPQNGSAIEIAQGHHIELKGRRTEARRDVRRMTIVRVVTGLDKDSSKSTMRTTDSHMMKQEMDTATTVDAIQAATETSTEPGIEMITMTTNDAAREVVRLKDHDLAHLAVCLRRAGSMVLDLKESKRRLAGMCPPDNRMQETSGMMDSQSTISQRYARS